MRSSRRHTHDDRGPDQVAALYLAADDARWLAEERGLSSYWEVARLLSEALPREVAETLESCWTSADILAQAADGDAGYYRRLQCHTAYLRKEHPAVYEEIVALVPSTREARACSVRDG